MKKSLGGIFHPYFLKNTPLKSEFLCSINKTVSKSSLHERLRPSFFFLTHEVMVLGKCQVFDFDRFLNLNILENYPAIFEILGSIQRTGCGKLLC